MSSLYGTGTRASRRHEDTIFIEELIDRGAVEVKPNDDLFDDLLSMTDADEIDLQRLFAFLAPSVVKSIYAEDADGFVHELMVANDFPRSTW